MRAVMVAGGYTAALPPQRPSLADPPHGEASPPTRLSGAWRGWDVRSDVTTSRMAWDATAAEVSSSTSDW